MKLKLKFAEIPDPGLFGLSGQSVHAVMFDDGHSLEVTKLLDDFIFHCEVLGMDLSQGFTIDDEKGDTE